MPSTVLSRFLAGAVLAVSTCSALPALPALPSPRILSEPVLGLRYEAARVKFDPLPGQVIANCENLNDNEDWNSVWFIYAQAQDASGRTYYATGGYDISRNAPQKPRSNSGDEGLILFTDRGSCTALEQVRQTFDARLFDEEMSEPVLRLLAADYAKRLERAFGGAAQLRTELRNQHIDKEALPAELLEALKPYF
jgi:hypothetical protein